MICPKYVGVLQQLTQRLGLSRYPGNLDHKIRDGAYIVQGHHARGSWRGLAIQVASRSCALHQTGVG